ncbi:hypothetical protein ACCO45_008113 [Purpureocillium lilacinum]|uniref:Uncharacterized protein n=1 Tax=Purpureocillium lilacinum TaxID=33203 RepID=A0ACC4DMD7_PURLI
MVRCSPLCSAVHMSPPALAGGRRMDADAAAISCTAATRNGPVDAVAAMKTHDDSCPPKFMLVSKEWQGPPRRPGENSSREFRFRLDRFQRGEDDSLHFLVMTKTTRVEARYSSCAEGITTSQCRRDGDSVAPDALEFASVADDHAGWKAMPRGSTEPARRLQRCKARERSRVDQGENIFQLRMTDSLL